MKRPKPPKYIICPDCETRSIVRPGALCQKHAATDDLLAVLEAIVSDAEKAMHPPSRMFAYEAAKAAIDKALHDLS